MEISDKMETDSETVEDERVTTISTPENLDSSDDISMEFVDVPASHDLNSNDEITIQMEVDSVQEDRVIGVARSSKRPNRKLPFRIPKKSGMTPQRRNTKRPSRKLEFRLRKEINTLKSQLQETQKKVTFWRAKTRVVSSLHSEKRAQIRKLEKRVKYAEELVCQLKQNLSYMSNNKEKSIVGRALSYPITNHQRAPCKSLSLYVEYYKNKATNPVNKELRNKRNTIKQCVTEFFEDDEVSSPAPGSRDFITRKKQKKRKRYLNDTIANLHKKFCKQYFHISTSMFYKLRPFWVVNLKISALETCLCREHENFKFILKKLRQHKLVKSKDIPTFIKCLCCDSDNINCMLRDCDKCGDLQLVDLGIEDRTTYRAWVTEKVKRIGAKGLIYEPKITCLKTIEVSISGLVQIFNQTLKKFLSHVFTVNHQARTIKVIKESLPPKAGYITVDFAQNYQGKYYRRIQAAHFGASLPQISLFTGVFYFKDEKNSLCHKSFVVVSDCLRHEAVSVWAFLKPVISWIFEVKPDLQSIDFQSDGPLSQFKNKNNFFLFNHFCRKLNLLKATWNFTAPGHTKTGADTAGGNAKAYCDAAVTFGTNVLCAKDVVDVLLQKSTKIKVFVIEADDVKNIEILMPPDLTPIPETKQVFQVFYTNNQKERLYFRSFSCPDCLSVPVCGHYDMKKSLVDYAKKDIEINNSKTKKNVKNKSNLQRKVGNKSNCDSNVKNDIHNIKLYSIGEWVVVIYDKKWFPGEITEVDNDILIISFMSRQGKKFSWPQIKDIQRVHPTQVLCKISSPLKHTGKAVNKYYLDEKEYQNVNEIAKNCKIIYDEKLLN